MKIVVVGGIAAGMSAAARARRNNKDAEIIVFEQGNIVSFGACGLPYFVGGWFDDPSNMIARTPEKFRESGIDVRMGHQVLSLNHPERIISVRNLESGVEFDESFDRLMIATGASPLRPPFPGLELENITTLTKLEEGADLKELLKDDGIKNITVIGAGFIGIEAVEACLHLGKSVRLIQLDERVLIDAFDKEITDIIESELKDKGVNLHTAEKVTAFTGRDGKVSSVVTDKDEYDTDLVILSVGVRPNTGFLADSGLDMLPNGAIVVDHKGQTCLDDVFSAGDCASVPQAYDSNPAYVPLATGANKLGRVVGNVISGAEARYPGSLASACIKVINVEAGRTGLSESEALAKGIECKSVFIKDKDQTNYYPGQSDIAVKLIYDGNTKKILGGQIVGGKGAVLRTNVIAAAITGGLTVDQLGFMDLCYAPPFARTWDVLNVAGNVAK